MGQKSVGFIIKSGRNIQFKSMHLLAHICEKIENVTSPDVGHNTISINSSFSIRRIKKCHEQKCFF